MTLSIASGLFPSSSFLRAFSPPFLKSIAIALCAAAAGLAQQSADVQLPDSLMAPGTQVKWVKKIAQYCEGPAVDLTDGTVYFTEQRDNNTLDWPIWKINPANPSDTGSRWISPSNQSNGLFVDGQGRVIAAQKGKIVRYTKAGAVDSVLATSGNGATFNQANDFSMARNGAFYFTDLGSNVFYVDTARKLKVAATGLSYANGIEWMEEENAVYIQAGNNQRFSIAGDGSLINGKPFFGINGPDGCEVDSHGNFYLCSYSDGVVHVVNGNGTEVGKITFKMDAGQYDTRSGGQGNIDNCHFGGTGRMTLYCTGDGGLFSLQLKVPGRAWPAAVPSALRSLLRPVAESAGSKAYRPDGRFWFDAWTAGPEGAKAASGNGMDLGSRSGEAGPRLPLVRR